MYDQAMTLLGAVHSPQSPNIGLHSVLAPNVVPHCSNHRYTATCLLDLSMLQIPLITLYYFLFVPGLALLALLFLRLNLTLLLICLRLILTILLISDSSISFHLYADGIQPNISVSTACYHGRNSWGG